MRTNRFGAVAVLLLAACVAEEKAGDAGANDVAVAPSAPAPEPTPAPPPEPIGQGSIPAAFHGAYDSSIEACGRPSDGRLTVSAKELRFHESLGIVRIVAPASSGAIEVEADYDGEGQSWRSRRELRLSEAGATLTISGDGTRMVRVRCPGAA